MPMRSLAPHENRPVLTSGPRRVGTPSTMPSGTACSASPQAMKYRRFFGLVPMSACSSASSRASAVA